MPRQQLTGFIFDIESLPTAATRLVHDRAFLRDAATLAATHLATARAVYPLNLLRSMLHDVFDVSKPHARVCVSVCAVQGAVGAITDEAQRRNAFLQQLRNRLAGPSTDEQEAVGAPDEPELNLKLLVTKHGMEDWMQARIDLCLAASPAHIVHQQPVCLAPGLC